MEETRSRFSWTIGRKCEGGKNFHLPQSSSISGLATHAPAGCSLEEKKGPWESNIFFYVARASGFFPVEHLQ